MDDITKLPDGSGFFTMTFDRRPAGFINWLKYTESKHPPHYARARRWLYFWRNFRTARTGFPPTHPPLPFWRALRWALSVS